MDLEELLAIKYDCEDQMQLEDFVDGWETGKYMNLPETEIAENEDN